MEQIRPIGMVILEVGRRPMLPARARVGCTDSPNGIAACLANLTSAYPGPERVWAINVGADNAIARHTELASSAGDMTLFFLGACSGGCRCIYTSQDAIGRGVGAKVVQSVDITALASWTHYVCIDSYCGTFTLQLSGMLPVSLESFRID